MRILFRAIGFRVRALGKDACSGLRVCPGLRALDFLARRSRARGLLGSSGCWSLGPTAYAKLERQGLRHR